MAASAGFAPYEEAGPLLLSKQPPTTKKPEPKADDWGTIYQHLEARLGMMRNWRWSWWAYWSQLARVYLPHRYHWVVTANTMNRGRPVNDQIINSTGTLAMRICAAGLLTGLMSPSRPWFRLGPAIKNFEVDEDGQRWLDDTAQRIYAVLAGSNFYTSASQLFQDVATFGTSVMLIYEDTESVIRCYVPCAGEYFMAVGGRLSIDTLYREFVFTVAQIVDWFGLDNCPQQIRTHWMVGGASLEREFIVAHAIEPNFALSKSGGGTGEKVRVVPGSFPFREVYWLRGQRTGAELSRRGFHEAPFMPARWSATANDPYGRGPGMDAFGDTAQLQVQDSRKAEFIEKIVRPPMVGDVTLKHQPSSILPGDITYVNAADGKKMFYPAYEVNPNGLPAITGDIEKIEARINRAFFVDVFLMISQMEGIQPKNELELAMRQGEKIQLLGPVIELFESESANKAITRVASIMQRRGLLAPPPPSLRGVPISIEYISLMKLAQRAAQTAGMEQMMKFGASMSEAAMAAGLPNPLRIVNGDETYRQYADAVGNPSKLMYTRREVEAHDAQRAEVAAAQQAMAALPPAVEAAKNLGQIDVGGGQNAVEAMLGTQGGQPPAQGAA